MDIFAFLPEKLIRKQVNETTTTTKPKQSENSACGTFLLQQPLIMLLLLFPVSSWTFVCRCKVMNEFLFLLCLRTHLILFLLTVIVIVHKSFCFPIIFLSISIEKGRSERQIGYLAAGWCQPTKTAYVKNLLFPYPWLLVTLFPEEIPGKRESDDLAVGETKENCFWLEF